MYRKRIKRGILRNQLPITESKRLIPIHNYINHSQLSKEIDIIIESDELNNNLIPNTFIKENDSLLIKQDQFNTKGCKYVQTIYKIKQPENIFNFDFNEIIELKKLNINLIYETLFKLKNYYIVFNPKKHSIGYNKFPFSLFIKSNGYRNEKSFLQYFRKLYILFPYDEPKLKDYYNDNEINDNDDSIKSEILREIKKSIIKEEKEKEEKKEKRQIGYFEDDILEFSLGKDHDNTFMKMKNILNIDMNGNIKINIDNKKFSYNVNDLEIIVDKEKYHYKFSIWDGEF